ncbi:hypothetical protein FB192DRAFT_1450894 [Mucor lusitanicus]|uniref:Uncharacterized protein n=2 Tax=Mucor circinelloides f. lusitanicus TaxID=29924 RepID=A0A168NVW4_MUCCL|nr:hypothetical protein FB192DRAFT_1450894 [Mucor lusitanicus]OAD06815.1 hypothetical protein MUCCIDRAFT_107407 [Mucor lusitanicus CBS 277.49]
MSDRPKRRKTTEAKSPIPDIVPQPDGRRYILVKPPPSDAVPPFTEARKDQALSQVQQHRVMETLGRAIYERRQKAASKNPIILKALPKGYVVEYSTNYKFSGHPSKLMFHSTSTFLEHLLWLEAMSHPKSIESRHTASTAEAASSSEPASPVPTSAPSPADSSSSRESTPTPDDSETIRVYPLKKVLIERHVNPHYYYPESFSIPLPKIQQSDESILLKSLRSSSK